MINQNSDDPTEAGYWRPLFELQAALAAELAEVYRMHAPSAVRERFAYPMIRLAHRGPMTISALATSLGLTHSAVSQTVTAMRAQGLVISAPGTDARTQVVQLTDEGRDLVPFLESEWRATEAAINELDSELASGLSEYVAGMTRQLQKRNFAERITAHLRAVQVTENAGNSPVDDVAQGSNATELST